jgi:hypothetical protein
VGQGIEVKEVKELGIIDIYDKEIYNLAYNIYANG